MILNNSIEESDKLNTINKKKYCNNIWIIYIFIFCFIYSICFIIFIFYIYNTHKINLRKKTNQIKTIEKQLSNYSVFDSIENAYIYDHNYFKLNNMNSNENLNKIGYKIIINCHSIEKGLSHFILRPFGKKKILSIIKLLEEESKYKNYEDNFSFINGINILREYQKTYEKRNWIDKKEYKVTTKFIQNLDNLKEIKVGAYILDKEDLKKYYKFNYLDFVKSRHLIRNFKIQKLRYKDIKEAIEIAKYSPSACNRQNIKIHYYSSKKQRQNAIDYSIGKEMNISNGVNTFIITYDFNGINSKRGRNQGYFNAGLFTMNLINTFHSKGIGSYLVHFEDNIENEEKLKKINNIPSNERITNILIVGYYDKKSFFPLSPRKEDKLYLKIH